MLEAIGDHGPLRVEAMPAPAQEVLRIDVRGAARVERWPPKGLQESMAWQILSTLADEIRFHREGGNPVVSLVKRRQPH